MRRFIVDTDTASDDAAALVIAVLNKEIDVLGITTVAGNVDIAQATANAITTLDFCGSDIPVYAGASRPLFRRRHDTVSVHGADGMGDCDIISPSREAEGKRAVEFILEMVEKYPYEVEIAVLGPATNIALAIMTDREVMKKVKRFWSMGTSGFGCGNATPVAEFNVFMDAEAYAVMLDSGVPVTVAGFDLCTLRTGLDKEKLAKIAAGNAAGRFLEKATSKLLRFNLDTRGIHQVDLPDAIAMAAALWDGFVTDSVKCCAKCCTQPGESYGQVIFYREDRAYEAVTGNCQLNCEVITAVDEKMFTDKFIRILS